jgi:CHASE3 domain sensor protein
MAREIAERVNGMRRYQLSALVAADERDQQLERATKAGKENVQLAEELEKKQRNPETRQIAGNMRTLNERYVRSHEQVVALGKEGKLDAMRELIQGEARKRSASSPRKARSSSRFRASAKRRPRKRRKPRTRWRKG